jgi:bifunctional non-homologous end joining protein LigD
VQAMSATSGALPTGPGWGYEMSWPGRRLFIDVAANQVRVTEAEPPVASPGDQPEPDVTRELPELVSMCADIDDALLEGHQLVVEAGAPIGFVCSDLLRLYGVDLTGRPYAQRRGSLARLGETHPLLTLSPVFDDAEATAAAAREYGLDGVVAKRLDSPYRPGTVSPDWVRFRFNAPSDPTLERLR